jgi:hypothetical protein
LTVLVSFSHFIGISKISKKLTNTFKLTHRNERNIKIPCKKLAPYNFIFRCGRVSYITCIILFFSMVLKKYFF